ncbi:MAG TPA: hypothetical protein VMU87_04225 [Stellaceae bacterium]|nr:hypothetical protein [Stellaceae bacterium]
MIAEPQTPEQSARQILRLIVGHFQAMPGRVLRETSLLQIVSADGWNAAEYQPGRTYALEHGWLNASVDTLTLTSAGYSAAFA